MPSPWGRERKWGAGCVLKDKSGCCCCQAVCAPGHPHTAEPSSRVLGKSAFRESVTLTGRGKMLGPLRR